MTMLLVIPFLIFLFIVGQGAMSAKRGKDYRKYKDPRESKDESVHESVKEEAEQAKTLIVSKEPKEGLIMNNISISGMMSPFSLVCKRGEMAGIFYDKKDPIGMCLSRIISGQKTTSTGQCMIEGSKFNMISKFFWHFLARKYFKSLGYSSDEVPPLPFLSGIQMLNYAAATKGLDKPEDEIKYWCQKLLISEEVLNTQGCDVLQADSTKISVACAFLGGPPVIVLHEPFHGLEGDLVGRVKIIDCAKMLADDPNCRSTVLILSKNIPENLKNVCSKIGFVHYSKLKWILPPKELAELAGRSLYINIDLDSANLNTYDTDHLLKELDDDMSKEFPNAEVTERSGTTITYELEFDYQTLAGTYTKMEAVMLRHPLAVQDYQISNPTLQDIAHYKTFRNAPTDVNPIQEPVKAEQNEEQQAPLNAVSEVPKEPAVRPSKSDVGGGKSKKDLSVSESIVEGGKSKKGGSKSESVSGQNKKKKK